MSALSRRSAVTSILAVTIGTTAVWGAGRALADGYPADPPGKTPGRTPPGKTPPQTGGIKDQLTAGDREINRKCIEKTMREAPTGATWKWHNPKTGNHGTVKPTSKLTRHAGETCRTFEEKVTLKDGRSETIQGRACRRRDGSWNIA
ncbi:MAG: hypothetical protein KIT16_17740 [Rhodospirillaceae bacterium]|nr:hypothetical protein [Rhodospirillaceae bacterium]